MKKPITAYGYDKHVTQACERLLVTLLRRLGPWRNSIFLVGGLVPRYLVKDRPPVAPAHAGTSDVDVVVDVNLLVNTTAYRTLEDNIRGIGFKRAENDQGRKLSWRWKKQLDDGPTLILEFLADAGDLLGGVRQELPSEGAVSAIHIPHSAIVFDHHDTIEITADLLDGGGMTTETVRHADIVSFTCLKAFAFDQRGEPKDAYDLCYCLEHYRGGPDALQDAFALTLKGKHVNKVKLAIDILKRRFCDSESIEGYRKDGPIAAARFEGAEFWANNDRIRRQRDLNSIVQEVIAPFI